MLQRLLITVLLGGLPRLVRPRRPVPIVWYDRMVRHRADHLLVEMTGTLARGTFPAGPPPLALCAGFRAPATHTATVTGVAGTALVVRTR